MGQERPLTELQGEPETVDAAGKLRASLMARYIKEIYLQSRDEEQRTLSLDGLYWSVNRHPLADGWTGYFITLVSMVEEDRELYRRIMACKVAS